MQTSTSLVNSPTTSAIATSTAVATIKPCPPHHQTIAKLSEVPSFKGFATVAFVTLNRFANRWNPFSSTVSVTKKLATTMAPSKEAKASKATGASTSTTSASKPLTFLELPVLETLSPLTEGTNLPPVTLEPEEEVIASKPKPKAVVDTQTASPPDTPTSLTSPTSPSRPGSVRRFLSKVSLNSSYASGDKEHDADSISVTSKAPMSPTLSVSGVQRSPSTMSKKGSWWRRRKSSSNQSINEVVTPARPVTPPPMLPEVKHAETVFGDDMFKGLN